MAKSGGKNRHTHFEKALNVAQLEHGRPIEMRMDWNHQEAVPAPKIVKQKPVGSPTEPPQKKQRESPPLMLQPSPNSTSKNGAVNRRNLDMAIHSLGDQCGANAIDAHDEDGMLVCKILRRLPAGGDCNPAIEGFEFSNNLGFITLPSQKATFASIRHAVESDLDDDILPTDEKGIRKRWKFYVPKLGPMSVKQEGKIGPALEFLMSTTDDVQLGKGTASDPLKVVIMDLL